MKFYNSVSKTLSKRGMNLMVGDLYDLQEIWKQWYRGNVNDFHYYKIVVNGKKKKVERKTLNIAKKFCEDMAKLLWTEKTQIDLGDEKKTKQLWDILDSKKNSFSINLPIFLEKALALGGGALVEFLDSDGDIVIDYIPADSVIPFKYTNSYISGLVTIGRTMQETEDDKKVYTLMTIHKYEGGKYTRENELYLSSSENDLGKQVPLSELYPNVKEKESVETDTPRFQYFKPNIANNLDLNSPTGISIFANCLDIFKSIDMRYDGFYNEFILGKKRILIDASTMRGQISTDENGNPTFVQYFDVDDTAFMGITGMDEQPVKEIDFSLRTDAYISAINADLDYASTNMGLGGNWFKFDGGGLKTATEVMSENSEAFRTKVHYDLIVNDVIYDLCKVICEMANIQVDDISIIPDDSIIEDKQTEIMKAQQELGMGLLSKKSYLMKYKGMTEEEADEELQKVADEQASQQQMQGMLDNPEEDENENLDGEDEDMNNLPDEDKNEPEEEPDENDEDKKGDK